MTNKILWTGVGLIFGTGIGFFAGYYIMGKEMAKIYDEEIAEMDQKIKALQDMMPDKNFEDNKKIEDKKLIKPKEPSIPARVNTTDYTQYSKKISDMQYEYEQNVIKEKESDIPTEPDPADSIAPSDEDEESDENYDDYEIELHNNAVQEEMYYEQVREYRNEYGDDIRVLGPERIDYRFPDFNAYDTQDLYWFVGDDTITDDDGNIVDEEELIGHELRDKKWTHRQNDCVWVRNNRLEKDFCVYRYTGTSEDFWIRGKQ